MAAGRGADIHRPVEYQVRLSATWRGLAQVDAAALATVNALEGITIFTVSDGTPVERGSTLAGVKITPLAIPGGVLKEAEPSRHRWPKAARCACGPSCLYASAPLSAR
jgi:hypothetical protein